MPVKATHGLPSLPVPAESLLPANGAPGSGVLPPSSQCPPLTGRMASKVPSGLDGLLDWMPFQNTSRPPGVAVASGSVARYRPLAMVTRAADGPAFAAVWLAMAIMAVSPAMAINRV